MAVGERDVVPVAVTDTHGTDEPTSATGRPWSGGYFAWLDMNF
jgi:hypothetical protein